MGGWGPGTLGGDFGDGENAAMVGEEDAWDSGQGLAECFGRAGESGLRGYGAELG